MTPQAQNIKFRRQLLEERHKYVALLSAKVDAEGYKHWKAETDSAIDKINERIRSSYGWNYPGARYGMPRNVADAIKAHKLQAA